jgi:class 3 adenylate cyclase/pimeloyl-ACP methyl ester carboxylesterase
MDAPPVQYTTTSDGVSIAWAEAGQGPALLHCGPTPLTHVQELFPIFEAYYGALARSFRLIIFDARGTGMSERDVADVSTATLLMDAEAVIDAAKLDRFAVLADVGLLALSTALQLATALPERLTHLALVSPFQSERELADTPLGRVGLALAQADWAVYVQTLIRVLGGFDPAESTWVDPMESAAAGWVEPSVGLQYVRVQEATDVGHLLAGVRQPTLVLRGEPGFVPARCCQRIAAKIPGAQFRQYSDPNYEQWAELIRAFAGQSSPATPLGTPAVSSAFRTVLFTDIVGSTPLMHALGDAAWRSMLGEHERLTREILARHGGAEIKTIGDSFMASFDSASRTVECAIELQRAFATRNAHDPETSLHVRIGVNAGEPVADSDDLFGTAVTLASRIMGQAQGGEILVSDVVRQLVAGRNFVFADRGKTLLKGFEDAVRLYEVSWRA